MGHVNPPNTPTAVLKPSEIEYDPHSSGVGLSCAAKNGVIAITLV